MQFFINVIVNVIQTILTAVAKILPMTINIISFLSYVSIGINILTSTSHLSVETMELL